MALQRMRRRSVVAMFAAGLVGGSVLVSPAALAEPAPPPPPPAPAPAPAPPPADPVAFPPPPPGLLAPAPAPGAPAPGAPAPGSPEADESAGPAIVNPGMRPLPIPAGTPGGQNPNPFVGQPPFVPPSFNPVDGALVGVAKPIIIKFQRPIANRQMAQDAVHITSNPPVPGRFYWISDTELRWRPQDFWPKGTTVSIDAAGTKSGFTVGESLVATIDNKSLQMEIMRDGELVETFPVSMGKKGFDTKNGTYYVLEKFADIVMDSSTYGTPVDDPEGYRLKVKDAVRIDNSGVFVHSAPWSVGAQGNSNVSHGCINLAPDDAKWFFDNFGSGDPVVIKNSTGDYYTQQDGAHDWQLF